MPVTLVVEPNPGGHRFQAVAGVVRLARRLGDVTLMTSVGGAATDEFGVFLAGLDVPVVEPFAEVVPSTPDFAAAIASFCREHGDVEHVIVMDGDIALKTWWRDAARAYRGLPRRPRTVFFLTRYPARLELDDLAHWKVRVAKGALLLAARATGTVHRAAGFAGREEQAKGWLVKRARDPAICSAHSRDRKRLRDELGLPQDRRLVGIFGGVNVRKNPPLVLEAVERAGADVDLVMAGPVAADIREWLDELPAERRARTIVADGFLDDDVLDKYLAASDVVALVMELEGPSGIQGKALAAGVPVVSAGSRTRERELRAAGSGVSTAFGAEPVAAAIRTVLDEPPAEPASGFELPTSESFSATVIGGPPYYTNPLTPYRWLGRRIAHRARREVVRRRLRPADGTGLIRLGSAYGGWWVPEHLVTPGRIAYCAGAGEDITFDLALHERGVSVRTLDPTPRAIAYVGSVSPDDERYRFEPVGLWSSTTELPFYAPADGVGVSHSAVNLGGTSERFTAPVRPVHELTAEFGDERVDILKLDIEGAEFEVIDALLAHGPLPAALLVEFDQPAPVGRVMDACRSLRQAGYTLDHIEGWNFTFTRPTS